MDEVDSFEKYYQEFIKNNKLILKTQQRFKRHNFDTEEMNKFALSLNEYKRIQSADSIETYAHGTSKDLVCRYKRT